MTIPTVGNFKQQFFYFLIYPTQYVFIHVKGFNVEKIKTANADFMVWDVGLRSKGNIQLYLFLNLIQK